jgi:hypothetical protein
MTGRPDYDLKLSAGSRPPGRSLAPLRVAPVAAFVVPPSGYLRPGRRLSLIRYVTTLRRVGLCATLAVAAVACAGQHFDPPPTPALIASMPDTIPCERAVTIKAGSDRQAVDAERNWLNAYYPGHGEYSQALRHGGQRTYDVLGFSRRDGRQVSVCFDITGSYGHF